MAYLPHGTTFHIGQIGSSGSLAVGSLIGITLPDRSRGEVETTVSGSGYDRSYMGGLREGGSIELTMRHDPNDAGQSQLDVNYETDGDANVECIITLPDSLGTFTFDAFVTSPPQGDLALTDDEAAEITATLKVSGGVTIV